MTPRRTFTDEFKRDAMRLARERGNLAQTARDLGIGHKILARWKKRLESETKNSFPGHGNARDQEVAQLKREMQRLQEENFILKGAVDIFTEQPLG